MSILKKKRIWNHKTKFRHSEKSKEIMSINQKGRIPWNKGKTNVYSPEVILKQKSYHLFNGKSCLDKNYTKDFNKSLREQVRSRDEYTCQYCGVHQDELSRRIEVHHIDYDKENCKIDNLITLCSLCHRRTNYNREWWFNYFKSTS